MGKGKAASDNETTERIIVVGEPDVHGTDNSVHTSKYTILTFLPIAIREQFRRNGNVYFLFMGIIMWIGWYTTLFDSALTPWTTIGPLAIVVAISVTQEGLTDLSRHQSDTRTNQHPCVVLRRADELQDGGERDPSILHGRDVDVRIDHSYVDPSAHGAEAVGAVESSESDSYSHRTKISFQTVQRMNIYAGDLVLVRNREMIPADIILLASSSEGGNAYIETSSIDGETNLKLRACPKLPDDVLDAIESRRTLSGSLRSSVKGRGNEAETIEAATKRVTRMSLLGHPAGVSALRNPSNETAFAPDQMQTLAARRRESQSNVFARRKIKKNAEDEETPRLPPTGYVAVLTSEPPNAAVNSYSGKLTLPPPAEGEPSPDIALGADNILLRGAILRNTEWAIGVACFTGSDTKLVRNSTKTPSKFSRIDQLTNRTVLIILVFMVTCAAGLSALYVTTHNSEIDKLFYVGFNSNTTEKWPYLPDLDAPDWETAPQNFIQSFFLNMTLLNNFVPLSLYITVEVIILAMMLFIALDRNMYHPETDTPAAARSTIVTDLGQVQYVFSDKTGTLTENVMRFKRCSVDGLVFGAPVEKATPMEMRAKTNPTAEDDVPSTSFHPLRQLLVTASSSGGGQRDPALDGGLAGYGEVSTVDAESPPQTLTFNAEMFLRVMCLCHTVVVEKDFDTNIEASAPTQSANSSGSKSLASTFRSVVTAPFGLCMGDTADDDLFEGDGRRRDEEEGLEPKEKASGKDGLVERTEEKGSDGAPKGFAYQAESPDEGALVGAASLTYGFQVLGRDSAGIHLAVSSPSILEDGAVTDGLKNGTVTSRSLATSTTSSPATDEDAVDRTTLAVLKSPREETWQVLAVNKFDSDRKRMSIIVRSPPELGSLPIVFCKGADSSMLTPGVCLGASHVMLEQEEEDNTATLSMPTPSEKELIGEDGAGGEETNEWEMAAMLSIQSHLGDFASEGLRTLVLGMRVLTDEECDSWLKVYTDAATAIDGREKKLYEAALQIESGLHIVGATAIEDKLQDGVPEAIATLGNSGIKLWVLTGDKRETAIEIGYSTKVLTPEMHLSEIIDGPSSEVKTKVAMDFLRLVKSGALPLYQKAALQDVKTSALAAWWRRSTHRVNQFFTMISDAVSAWFNSIAELFRQCIGSVDVEEKMQEEEEAEVRKDEYQDPIVRRRAVRKAADNIIAEYLSSLPESARRRRKSSVTTGLPARPQGWKVGTEAAEEELDEDEAAALASDAVPNVFRRASSAKSRLDDARLESGAMMNTSLRSLSIAAVTAKGLGGKGLVDEDTLSLKSFLPESGGDLENNFDKKRRTILERLFAVDRDVRKGRLVKHAKPEVKPQVTVEEAATPAVSGGARALVVEGAALLHLLGDPVMEEMIFSVASSCDAVIACRVSPKQKALLVNLVRNYVSPTPVTLAIGDGANDVGMIQAAHVGVGVSGKEGQQAVNASDFAIAQFRFLKDLVLVHGRWNYVRMSKVVLFSFYKNAVLAGLLVLYSGWGLFSGYPLFDSWVLSMLNFVAGFPILFLGIFDRDLERDYVLENPDVYASGAQNEHLNIRVTMRYAFFTVIHAVMIYYLSIPSLSGGGGATSAFEGLMHNDDRNFPGDGVGDDVKVVGLNVFTILIVHLAFKVLVESGSYIIGYWPSIRCRKEEHSFVNRVAWTFVGISWLSIIFFLFGVYVYQVFGTQGASSFSPFTYVANHTFNTRSISWTVIVLVPTATNVVDIAAKVFANTYFPMQSQIHREIHGAERGKTVLSWRRWTGMTAS